jgi:hypothetical protein
MAPIGATKISSELTGQTCRQGDKAGAAKREKNLNRTLVSNAIENRRLAQLTRDESQNGLQNRRLRHSLKNENFFVIMLKNEILRT